MRLCNWNLDNVVDITTLFDGSNCDLNRCIACIYAPTSSPSFTLLSSSPSSSYVPTLSSTVTDAPSTDSPTDPLSPTDSPNFADCSSLEKKTCKKNKKKEGRCEYVYVKSCKFKSKDLKQYKKKCKKLNNDDKSVMDKDACLKKEEKNVGKICKLKKLKKLGYCRAIAL